ncbi:MAG TPA: hypothetical protein PK987_10325 [Ferruginibacter sp.]|nr:hypothetical protein [Ferruginibacter sp.]
MAILYWFVKHHSWRNDADTNLNVPTPKNVTIHQSKKALGFC